MRSLTRSHTCRQAGTVWPAQLHYASCHLPLGRGLRVRVGWLVAASLLSADVAGEDDVARAMSGGFNRESSLAAAALDEARCRSATNIAISKAFECCRTWKGPALRAPGLPLPPPPLIWRSLARVSTRSSVLAEGLGSVLGALPSNATGGDSGGARGSSADALSVSRADCELETGV